MFIYQYQSATFISANTDIKLKIQCIPNVLVWGWEAFSFLIESHIKVLSAILLSDFLSHGYFILCSAKCEIVFLYVESLPASRCRKWRHLFGGYDSSGRPHGRALSVLSFNEEGARGRKIFLMNHTTCLITATCCLLLICLNYL